MDNEYWWDRKNGHFYISREEYVLFMHDVSTCTHIKLVNWLKLKYESVYYTQSFFFLEL